MSVEENAEKAATMDAIFRCAMVYLIYRGVKWCLGVTSGFLDSATHSRTLHAHKSLFYLVS